MKKYLPAVIFSSVCASFLLVNAINVAKAAPFSTFAIGPEIGTTGFGMQVSTPLWPNRLNLTTGYSGFGLGYHGSTGGQAYHGRFQLGGAPVYLSVFPFSLPFHLDAGIFFNQNHIDVDAKPNNGVYTFNGHQYTENMLGTVSGGTHWNSVAPYLGIGWGNPFAGSRWTFTANAGVILEGGANARISAVNEDAVPGARANIDAYQSTFNHRVNSLTAFPVVNVGFDFRF